MGNVQDVEVGPIYDQSHAEVVAADYIQNHPEYEWTGHWNTTQPGEMSTIKIRRREAGTFDIDDLVTSSQPSTSHYLPGLENALQSFQQSLTTFIDDSMSSAMTSAVGQSTNSGHRNSTALTASSSLRSDWEFLNPTDHDDDSDDDTDDDTDNDDGRFHSLPRSPIIPPRTNLANEDINIRTSSESNLRRADLPTADAPTCSEVTDLHLMFPNTDEIIICDLLETNNYNVDKTIEDLLQLVPDTSNTTQGDAGPNTSSNSSLPIPACPVCYEALKPPKRIFQCANGHLVCGVCHEQPQLRGCPTCRQPIMGRATAMEQFLVDLQSCAQNKN